MTKKKTEQKRKVYWQELIGEMNPGHWFSAWLLPWCVAAGSSSRKHSQQHSQHSQHRKHKDYQQHHKPVHNEYNTEYYDEESMNIRRKLSFKNFLLKASAFIVCRLIHSQLFLLHIQLVFRTMTITTMFNRSSIIETSLRS